MRLTLLSDPPPPPPSFLVPGLIPEGGFITLAGDPGTGKSLVAASLAVAAATGGPWLGRPVKRGAALFLSAEAAVSTQRRIRAMARQHGEDVAVAMGSGDIDLLDPDAAPALIAAVDQAGQSLGEAIRLVVLDALGSCTRGADENASRDMSRATGALLELIRARQVTVLLLAHVTKSGGDRRVRGHSGLLADVDTHLAITGSTDLKSITVIKQRDAEPGDIISFRITTSGDVLDVEPVSAVEPDVPGSSRADMVLAAVEAAGGAIDRSVLTEQLQGNGVLSQKRTSAVEQLRRVLLDLKQKGLIAYDTTTISIPTAIPTTAPS